MQKQGRHSHGILAHNSKERTPTTNEHVLLLHLLQEVGWREHGLDAEAVAEQAERSLHKLLVRFALELCEKVGLRVSASRFTFQHCKMAMDRLEAALLWWLQPSVPQEAETQVFQGKQVCSHDMLPARVDQKKKTQLLHMLRASKAHQDNIRPA